MSAEQMMVSYLNANFDRFAKYARDIWEHPEIGLQEEYASKLIAEQLEAAGFEITWGVGQMPTAFVASWGEGQPTIGILGEYDALPGLSQSDSPERDVINRGGPGHGCGHNLYGIDALGAAAPHLGRSALDGALLMDVGVNYLREHIEQDSCIHSVITNGGQAPNVVPPEAHIWYFVRAPKREQVEAIYERMLDIAKGAALMSGTTYDVEFMTGCYDLMPNGIISNIMLEKMEALGGIEFDHGYMEFARRLQESIPDEMIEADAERTLKMASAGTTREDIGEVLCENVIRPSEEFTIMHGSTEVGDVSHITPTGNLITCCHPLGTPPHSWQTVASSGSSVGYNGMNYAAKAMALTGYALLTNQDTLRAAREEFKQSSGRQKYVTPLPEDAVPR